MFTTISNPQIVCDGTFQSSALILANFSEDDLKSNLKELPHGLVHAPRRRKIQFLAGRHCAKKALNKAERPGSIAVGLNSDMSPKWPSDVVGSVTHTSSFVAAVVAPRSKFVSIGLNAEKVFTESAAKNLWQVVLTKKEIASFNWKYKHYFSAETYFSLVFSAKEAVYKCFFPIKRVRLHYQDININPRINEGCTFSYNLYKNMHGKEPLTTEGLGLFDFCYGHIHTSLCIEKENA